MAVDDIVAKLQKEGWNVSQEFLQAQGYQTVNAAINNLLNTDLKYAGTACLSTGDSKEKSTKLSSPLVLQVTNIRNVAAPKANEESQFAPRMLRITLTDGKGFIQGIEIDHISGLSLKTAPGTKIKIESKVSYLSGYYLLTPRNISVLGGVVADLQEKWRMSKEAMKYHRVKPTFDGSGPPPWVPFGKGIVSVEEKGKDFKALADVTSKPKDDKFEESRTEVVTKLCQESSGKVFGGGKQMRDTNVQKIVNAGFTTEQAEEALCRNRNNLDRAFRQLKRPLHIGEEPEEEEESYGRRGRGGRRGGGRGRGGRRKRDVSGPDGSDDEVYMPSSTRPSGPASLCDFLDLKSHTQKAAKGDIVYQQQLRELNKYSRNNDCLDSKDASHVINYDYRNPAGSQFETFFTDQNYQQKGSGNKYDNHKESDRYRGNRPSRGSGNYENRKPTRGLTVIDDDIKTGYHDSGKKQNTHYQSDHKHNNRESNYHSRGRNYDNNQKQFGRGNTGYQDNQYDTRNTGNYQDSNKPTNSYRGDNYNKRGYSSYSDNNRQPDNYSKTDTRNQAYSRGNSNYGRGNFTRGRGNSFNDRGYSSNERGYSHDAPPNRTNESSTKNTYNQEYSANGQYSSYNKPEPKHNTYGNAGAATTKKTYTQSQAELIGKFRQCLEISGDYQVESRQQTGGDYYREDNTQSQRRSQYGRTNYSGSRGRSRGGGYRGSYHDGY